MLHMGYNLEEIAAELTRLLKDHQLFPDISLVKGHELKETDLPEVLQLQAAGASWDWVALSLKSCNFWEFHIGMLPNAQNSEVEVGIHWLEGMDAKVRPWATALYPESRVQISATTGEYQLPASAYLEQPITETAAQALALAAKAGQHFNAVTR